MKHKVAELEGALLDAAVAMAEGVETVEEASGLCRWDQDHGLWRGWNPSTDWRDGGPIIEREEIMLRPPWCRPSGEWTAWKLAPRGGRGPTPLIAAMRAYVASKYGAEIEL